MDIELKSVKIADLIDGYVNDPDAGVRGFGGKLDIRPPYQREFRYDLKQQQAVIETILKGFPLNIMYWSEDSDGNYEMIDGQQRTLSICEFFTHGFNIEDKDRGTLYFSTLTADEKKAFFDYELTVYFCNGTDKEKLDWFRVINIAGEKLLDQELLNAVYVGPFVTDARRHFSKDGCPAYKTANDLLNGVAREQAYLASILKWAARHDGIAKVDDYMAQHQFDPNANKLWAYFVAIITWVRSTFPKYRKEMKGLDWAEMFDEFGENTYDTATLEKQIHDLMEDDEIMKKAGIYRYVLSGDLHDLSFRAFDKKQKREAYERQKGICVHCGKHFELEGMEADHIKPWKEGGTTVAENCQMLCRNCNRIKGAK
ncbi:MAG: DUF262 domain-containing protein [Muribaculum sp.]|nr:DUF262 domain-containing protein [Muribaculaceae bacterium]MCM1081503.1 DUF262 domain-containing protein [Muribaculum sp.]